MAANKRPDWLPDGMDADSSYYLDIRIVTPTSRDGWFELDKVVDADVTNFTDLIQGVVDKYPCGYGDIVRLFYFCMESKVNIQISSDQELVEMFAKHKDSKRCLLTLAYHSPSIAPIEFPPWNFSTTVTSVEPPITPSIACPSLAGPSQSTQNQTDKTESLLNPNPLNEHVGVDDEGLYIVLGPEHPLSLNYSQWQAESPGPDDASSESDESGESDESDEETIVEDMDEIIKDREPKQMPDVDYDQNDPPMSVGTVYSNMAAFKIALASHAVKHEFNYDIEKSEPGRYRVNCIFKSEGCPWRIHAATQKDDLTVKVVKNPWPHDCFSTRRLKDEICVGVTQFWVCNQVVDWLKEDGNIKCTELQRRLKGKHKILVPYRRVYKGGGRRKNRLKSAIEGGNQQKGKKHECPICHQLGHRWYTCKNGDPEDIAAMEAERGPPKKKQKKSASCSTETSIVVATPSVMVFPHNEAVANATHIKRKRKSSSTKGAMNSKGSATTTSSSAPSNRSGTGSNDPVPLQILQSVPSQEDTADGPAQMEPPQHVLPHASPRKKMAVKKKLTPKKFQIASACPASPASNTRSKKNLNM